MVAGVSPFNDLCIINKTPLALATTLSVCLLDLRLLAMDAPRSHRWCTLSPTLIAMSVAVPGPKCIALHLATFKLHCPISRPVYRGHQISVEVGDSG